MLLSAKIDIPIKLFGHGFLTREGLKMGKTLGNILDPNELLKTYEKGIEDLMMSCGSGSVACGYHLAQSNSILSPTKIIGI